MYIDAHVHLRDFKQKYKETIKHGLEVARDSGVDAVFDMPNTDPPLTTRDLVVERLKLAEEANVLEVFYGLHVGLTADSEQVKQAVDISREFKNVVGMKLYAGHSVGNLGVTKQEDQQMIYEILAKEGYMGVLVVHAEKESFIRSNLWDPSKPVTHCDVRSEEAEIASVLDQMWLSYAAKFKGKLHITHISSPIAVAMVNEAKLEGRDVSCSVCPHHFIYDRDQMNVNNGILLKMNPPLRRPKARLELLKFLETGEIDWIDTDHAPHTLEEKIKLPFMSGIPGLPYWPLFERYLKSKDFTDKQIEKLTFFNAANRYGLDILRSKRLIKDRTDDYSFNPYSFLEVK